MAKGPQHLEMAEEGIGIGPHRVTYDREKRRQALAELLRHVRPDLKGEDFKRVLDEIVAMDEKTLSMEG